MKKTIIKIAAVAAVMSALVTGASAVGSYGWYCMRKKDHERVKCEANMAFVEDHGGVYVGKDPDEKVLYLTFDAGYENGNIAKILDTLKAHNARAAFFVLAHLIKNDTDLVRRMQNEGHLVCNHTSRHKDMSKMSDADFEAELRSLENTAAEYGIEIAKFYRPPEGRFSEENLICADKLGYTTVFWSVAYADWDNAKQPPRDRAKKLLLDNTHNGAVILLHPTSATNAAILDELLTAWENEGYRFGTLDEFKAQK